MITIVPASPSEGAAIREREGFPAAACLILRDGAEPAGYVCYQIEGSRLELLAVRGEDGLLLEGLVRGRSQRGGAGGGVGGLLPRRGSGRLVGTAGLSAKRRRAVGFHPGLFFPSLAGAAAN